jgi:membrane-associated phospholipid phosphatase
MKRKYDYGKVLLGILAFSLLIIQTSCKKEDPEPPVTDSTSTPAKNFDASVAIRWNQLFLEVSRYAPGYRPPVSARALGYMGLAAYEAAQPGMPGYRNMALHFGGLNVPTTEFRKDYHWPLSVNAAYATSFRKFFPHVEPNHIQAINNLETTIAHEFSDVAQDVKDRSKAFGSGVANAVHAWSVTDHTGNIGYTAPHPPQYIPPVCDGCWQPTGPDFTLALLPYWGQARAFAAQNQDYQISAPLAYNTNVGSPMYIEAMEIYSLYPLSYEDAWIAEFWGDDIFELTCEPAGRWISVANQAAQLYQINLETAVELYAKLGMALCDGGIITWHNKYEYNVLRPSDYIQHVIDPNWQSHLLTLHDCINPPFPAYPSGHATFGAAAAGIFNSFFGYQVSFTDYSHADRQEFNGTPRSFSSWNQMADENAYSRLPLGVHFQMDADAGLSIGYQAAYRVNNLPWKY